MSWYLCWFCVDICLTTKNHLFNLVQHKKSVIWKRKIKMSKLVDICVYICLTIAKIFVQYLNKVIWKRKTKKYSFRRWADIYFPSSLPSSTYSTGLTTSIRYSHFPLSISPRNAELKISSWEYYGDCTKSTFYRSHCSLWVDRMSLLYFTLMI